MAFAAAFAAAPSAQAISLTVSDPGEALLTEGVSFSMSVGGVPEGFSRDVSITDADLDANVNGCYWYDDSSCTKHVDANFPTVDGGPVTKHYRFDATADGETAVVYRTVTFRQPEWAVSLDGPDEVNADDSIPLKVTVDPQAVSPYPVSVFNTASGVGVGGCWTYVGACTSTVRYLPLSSTPYVMHFRAELAAGTDVLADDVHDVTVFPPNIGLTVTVPGIGLPGHTYTVTVDSSVHYYLPWPIVLRDAQGNAIGTCRTDQAPCSFTVVAGAEGTSQGFTASVEDGSTTVAQTSTATVHASDPLTAGTSGGAGPHFTIAALAAAFGSAAAVCDVVLTFPGTHNTNSSVSDQWLACDAVAQSGGSAEAAIRAALGAMVGVAVAGGGQSLLDALENWIWINYGNNPPTHPPVDPPTTAPGPTPAPVASAIDDVAAALHARAATLTATEAATIAKECLYRVGLARLAAEDLCTRLPIFSPGADYPTATQHRIDALRPRTGWPAWVRLTTRVGAPDPWYRSQPECQGSTRELPCDEFPENRTYEGGNPGTIKHRPSLLKLPLSDNSGLGGKFSAFRSPIAGCGLTDSEPFLVVPTPTPLGLPTKFVCG